MPAQVPRARTFDEYPLGVGVPVGLQRRRPVIVVVDVAQMSRTWVQRAVQADLLKVGRELGKPSNKVGPTAAGAERHRASAASRTRTRSDKKLQAGKDSSLTR